MPTLSLSQMALVVLVETTVKRKKKQGKEVTAEQVIAAIPGQFAALQAEGRKLAEQAKKEGK